MDRNEIIRMARISIIGYPDCDPENIPPLNEDEFAVFECFAALVASAEREECAAMFADEDYLFEGRHIAAAIRARGNQ